MRVLNLFPSVGPVLLHQLMDGLVGPHSYDNAVHAVVHILPQVGRDTVGLGDIGDTLGVGIAELGHRGHEIDNQHRQGNDDDKRHQVQTLFQGQAIQDMVRVPILPNALFLLICSVLPFFAGPGPPFSRHAPSLLPALYSLGVHPTVFLNR